MARFIRTETGVYINIDTITVVDPLEECEDDFRYKAYFLKGGIEYTLLTENDMEKILKCLGVCNYVL